MGGSLDDFDEVVRNDLPIAVDSSLGSGLALVPPRSLYFLCLGCLLFSFDLLLHVYDISQASRWFLFGVAAMFIWNPVWIMAVTAVEHKILQCSVLAKLCIRFAVLPPSGLWLPFAIDLHANAPLWLLIFYTSVVGVLANQVYSGHLAWRRHSHELDAVTF